MIFAIGSQLSVALRTMIQVVLILFGSVLAQTMLLVPKFMIIFSDNLSLDPDRRMMTQFTPGIGSGGAGGGLGNGATLVEMATMQASAVAPRTVNHESTLEVGPNGTPSFPGGAANHGGSQISVQPPTAQGMAALMALQASMKIAQLVTDLERLRSDYDSHCARYKVAEENLRKQREKIDDMERDMAEKQQEVEYLRDHLESTPTPNGGNMNQPPLMATLSQVLPMPR